MTVSYPIATATGPATIGLGMAVMTTLGLGARHGLPGAIPTDELFFWTRRWQAGEAESAAARAAGDVREFSSGRDAVRWLLSDDD